MLVYGASNAPFHHTLFNCFRPMNLLLKMLLVQLIDEHLSLNKNRVRLRHHFHHNYFNLRKVCADDQKQLRAQLTKDI